MHTLVGPGCDSHQGSPGSCTSARAGIPGRLSGPWLADNWIAGLELGPRTVEYHLHKVFTKLGITSREHLDRVLPGD